jgi:hypothetical protein
MKHRLAIKIPGSGFTGARIATTRERTGARNSPRYSCRPIPVKSAHLAHISGAGVWTRIDTR